MPYIGKKPADIIATVIDTTTGTFSGEVDAGSLDVSGNADIDGITNLDNTDIDGTLNVQGETTLQTHLNMGDNDIIKLGDSADLQIYHDSTRSYIEEGGLGGLWISTNGTEIKLKQGGGADEEMLVATPNGSVDLYYNNQLRFATTSVGIQVDGPNPEVRINDNNETGSTNLKFHDSVRETAKISVASGTSATLQINMLGTERMRIDSSGSVGIGTTPNSGMTALTALQIGYGGGFQSHASSTNSIYVLSNAYYDGTWRYKNAGSATEYKAINGEHIWETASSGSADGAITWSEAMRIDSSGNVGIGTTSPSELLEVNSTGSSAAIEVSAGQASTTTGEAKIVLRSLHSSSGTTYSRSEIASLGVAGGDSDLIFRTTTTSSGPVERMRIDSSGRLLLNTTTVGESSGDDLTIATTGQTGITIRSGTANAGSIYFSDATSGVAQYSGYIYYDHNSNNLVMGTNSTERMRIDSSGNVLVGVTSTSIPGVGNTTLGVSLRGGSNNSIAVSRGADIAGYFNRNTNDGDILSFRKDGTQIGSIGTQGGTLEIGSGDVYLQFNGTNDWIKPVDGSGSNKPNVDLGTSGAKFKDLYLSGGVYLGGTGSSNFLSDYEIGTWTPTMNDNIGGSATLSQAHGVYTKIGRMVTLHGHLQISSTGTTTGANPVLVSGLPFTVANNFANTGIEANGSVSLYDNFGTSVTDISLMASDTTVLQMTGKTSGTTTSLLGLTWTNIGGSANFRFSITYFTT
jgi:hypothetical protein